MTSQIIRIRYCVAVVLLAVVLAVLVWTAVSADGPALSPPEWPTATPPAPGTDAYPAPDPYPAPYPGPAYLPFAAGESYP